MDKIDFSMTADGSVGLYDEATKDIYHSVTGALKESFDKFIIATDFENFCQNNGFASVADICFGIGYNTKTAIYTAQKTKSKIKIEAFELFKEVAFLSPFVNDGLKSPEINIFLLSYFLSKYDEEFTSYIEQFLRDNSEISKQYFDPDMCLLFKNNISGGYKYNPLDELYAVLHNIYYQNVSTSMKRTSTSLQIADISFDIFFGDARVKISETKSKYDFVFLDAFTPHKQPLLWTYEFLSEVKSKMNPSSILSTYSNSTPVRKTFSDLGFFVGKIILDDAQFGTIASMDKNNIKYDLSQYDLGLMKTKAGMPYHDENFSLTSHEILINRENVLKNCDIMSATEYKRKFQNEH